VSGDEPVTSPDQHKPGHRKLGRVAALGVAVVLLLMIFGNHRGRVEDIFLLVIAAGLIGMVIGDVVLRKNGLRSE
jgi:multisubunit Na+/H+ antiporter MnhB subunit